MACFCSKSFEETQKELDLLEPTQLGRRVELELEERETVRKKKVFKHAPVRGGPIGDEEASQKKKTEQSSRRTAQA